MCTGVCVCGCECVCVVGNVFRMSIKYWRRLYNTGEYYCFQGCCSRCKKFYWQWITTSVWSKSWWRIDKLLHPISLVHSLKQKHMKTVTLSLVIFCYLLLSFVHNGNSFLHSCITFVKCIFSVLTNFSRLKVFTSRDHWDYFISNLTCTPKVEAFTLRDRGTEQT